MKTIQISAFLDLENEGELVKVRPGNKQETNIIFPSWPCLDRFRKSFPLRYKQFSQILVLNKMLKEQGLVVRVFVQQNQVLRLGQGNRFLPKINLGLITKQGFKNLRSKYFTSTK